MTPVAFLAVVLCTLFLCPKLTYAGDLAGISKTCRSRSTVATSLCSHLIEPSGYPCSEHSTKTKDGYLLGLQRVSSSIGKLRGAKGPPVLLLHGLFMGGDCWFLNSPDESLGFILADQGFDVWVGNVRGTHWSHGHVTLSVEDKFLKGELGMKFKPYSKYPPCFKDMSFWLSDSFTENNLCEIVRGVAGDLVEEVRLIDNFTNKKGMTSHCYRIAYRSMERSLTDDEINELQWNVRDQVQSKLNVVLR